MNLINEQKILTVIDNFNLLGEVTEIKPMGNGHINGTFKVKCDDNGIRRTYSLQKVNTYIFKDVDGLMNNITGVTSFLREKLIELGKDPEKGTLNFIKTKDGKNYYRDEEGECWRAYVFVDDVVALDRCRDTSDFYKCGYAFGDFQYMLSSFPADTLTETIVDFHNTPWRFDNLKKAFEADVAGRADSVKEEYQFAVDRINDYGVNIELNKKGLIPFRVTHNDTKLNNILLDKETGDPLCIIDLDTVMPGLSVNDFGDSIRFGASTATEDEKDLDKVTLDLELYEAYVNGFIKGCRGCLTEAELRALPMGAKLMTMECGMRFLTDYLENDVYFKTEYPEHNLDRAHTQFKLTYDMEQKWDKMNEIVLKAGGLL